MKKKIMSPEALAALAKGTQLAQPANVPEPGADGGTGENEQLTDSQADTGEGEASESTEETFTAEAKAAFEGQIEALTVERDGLQAQVTDLAKEVEDLKAAAIAADAQIKASAQEAAEFRELVVDQVANMRIALALTAVDMKNWTNEAILREHAAVAESFEKALSEGSRVPESQPEQKKTTMTNLDAANYSALGF